MTFERVAKLAKLAASDSDVLTALQNDPERIRKPLQLSEAQVRALLSASAFSTARPALTTSRSENPVADVAALQLGTLGTLLPPEGQGAFPGTGELPPSQAAPNSSTPSPHSPSVAPRGTPHGSIPRTPSTPQTPRHSPGTPATPGAPRQGSGTPQGSGQGNGSGSGTKSGKANSSCGCCACDVAFVAITAQVSTTAQAALTAIASIAGLD